ncbi:hypothetical protein E2C01_048176 [Portunus trituberculatus]|uniref:Uncharacterized protein n=1 Tax=Portunus trituberculatus TaxID=210409 RepID=A0A5B7G9W0_PORTR|nr:hypothetical protein [Portunus trituberculatus]
MSTPERVLDVMSTPEETEEYVSENNHLICEDDPEDECYSQPVTPDGCSDKDRRSRIN